MKITKTPIGLKKSFCFDNAVIYKRLSALENTVAEVMDKVSQILTAGSENSRKVGLINKIVTVIISMYVYFAVGL